MDAAFVGLIEHYGLSGLGWIIAAGMLLMLMFGKLRTSASVNDQRRELESRVLDRDSRIEDEREDKESWQRAYLTVMQAREVDQKTLRDAVDAMHVTADLITKLREALARVSPPDGGGSDVA